MFYCGMCPNASTASKNVLHVNALCAPLGVLSVVDCSDELSMFGLCMHSIYILCIGFWKRFICHCLWGIWCSNMCIYCVFCAVFSFFFFHFCIAMLYILYIIRQTGSRFLLRTCAACCRLRSDATTSIFYIVQFTNPVLLTMANRLTKWLNSNTMWCVHLLNSMFSVCFAFCLKTNLIK